MPDAASPPERYGQDVPWWRRPLSLVIAILVNLLLIFMLSNLGPSILGTKNGQGTLTTFNLSNDNKESSSAKKQSQQKQQQRTQATRATTVPMPKPTVEPPHLPVSHLPSDFIQLSQDDYAAADVSKIASAPGSNSGSSSGSGAGDSAAAGNGPNGEPLYAAEWFREPTDAELQPFMPKTIEQGAWGEIACRTIARYHVDDCVALGDSPAGSHLARAIQQAGWQFLVKPPRVGGKSMVGAWVRIRITFDRVRARR